MGRWRSHLHAYRVPPTRHKRVTSRGTVVLRNVHLPTDPMNDSPLP